MNKIKLERFIQKYNLGGNVERVIWNTSENKLSTSFITPDKSLLGKVSVDKFSFEDTKLGVYSTNQLQRMLAIMSDNIEAVLHKTNNTATSLKVTDNNVTINFMLANLAVIEKPPKHAKWPTFDTIMDIDNNFINNFIRSKAALPDANTFTLLERDSDTIDVVIGHSSVNTNHITISIGVKEKFLFEEISFDANLFKEILIANRECSFAKFEVSDKGLAHLVFEVDEFKAEYYLTSTQDVD